jgi:glycosyltransferase involved in cell wall biosynthesis
MKIIHVIEYFQPQLGYQETFLAKEHAKLGHEVYVVTSDRYSPWLYSGNAAKSVLGKRLKKPGFFIEEGIQVWRLKTLIELPQILWMGGLMKKLKELEPDLVIVHGIVNIAPIRIALMKKRKKNFKLVFDDHMVFFASNNILRLFYFPFKWFFSCLIQRNADVIVGTHYETSIKFMNKYYGIPPNRVTLIPLGADESLFRFDSSARNQIRHQYSVTDKQIVFIYAGKMIKDKGPHILIRAAMNLMKKHDKILVFLLGNGSQMYVEEMKHLIKTENLDRKFIWHNTVPNNELYRFYSSADVAVWPRECSLSMIEAMACNLPIIISDCSEVNERVNYNNGLTYHAEDIGDLEVQMEKLFDANLRKQMGVNGRKLVEEKLNWRTIAIQFINAAVPEKNKL